MDGALFYGELQQKGSHLLNFKASGDKYQVFMGMVRRHIVSS